MNSINVKDEAYFHFLRENYLNALKQDSSLTPNIGINDVANIYKKHYNRAVNRFNEIQKILLDEEGNKIIDLANFVTNNDLTSTIDNALGTNFQQLNLGQRIKNTITNNTIDQSIWEKGENIQEALNNGDVQEALNQLNNFLTEFNGIINDIILIDKTIIDYCNNNKNAISQSLIQTFGNGDKNSIQLFNVNKSQLTSFNTLKKRIAVLQRIANSGKISANTKVTFSTNGGKESKTVFIAEALGHFTQLVLNLLAGLGESYTALYAISEIKNLIGDFIGDLKTNKQITVDVKGVGEKTKIQGKLTKSDIEVNINNNTAIASFGISAKGQFKTSSGKKTVTVFQTGNMGNYLNSALIDHIYRYYYVNNTVFNLTASQKAMITNRYIAACNFDKAVNGEIKNVLFLSYLNKIITIDSFYDYIYKLALKNIKSAPSINIKSIKQSTTLSSVKMQKWLDAPNAKKAWNQDMNTSKGEGYIDTSPTEKNNYYALQRSKMLYESFCKLNAQIRFAS